MNERMTERWMVNLCPFLHFDNARTETYEHNISIASWNIKNVLDYLDIDETHRFCLDQVTLLEGFQRLFPNYWDMLKQRVLEGRIEIVGGAYVMPDFILPAGESLVRQFQYGLNYFREEVGIDIKTGWFIDSPGHNSQIPQILRQCGIDSYFFWKGQPFDSPSEFIWKGKDGSRVIAVWLSQGYDVASWLSETTRDAFSRLLQIAESADDRSVSRNLLIPVGGELIPPLPHLADIVRQWNDAFPDMRMDIVNPSIFINKLKSVQARLPVIEGELTAGRFSSINSGGLSARVKLKQKNRRLEVLLYLLELYNSVSGWGNDFLEIDNIWRKLLFNQDHNILRGTCTDTPYQLAIRRYDESIEKAEELLSNAIKSVVDSLGGNSEIFSFVVFNPLPWIRDDIVRIELPNRVQDIQFEIMDSTGESVPYQFVESAQSEDMVEVVLIAKKLPSLGYRIFNLIEAEENPEFESSLRFGKNWIENEDYSIEFDDFSGSVTRLFDKKNQNEIVRSNANVLVMDNEMGDLYRHEESIFSDESHSIISTRFKGDVKIKETGPVRIVLEITGAIENTERTQRVILYEKLNRIDFETFLNFKEYNKLVRVEFPLMIFSDCINIGSQFGFEGKHIDASDNIDWEDNAKPFSALDWVDCTGSGSSLLISAFGLHEYSYQDGIFSITLLRSVSHLSHGRDDQVITSKSSREWGPHKFKYAIIPHTKSTTEDKAWRSSKEHIIPLISYPLDKDGQIKSNDGSFMSMKGHELELVSIRSTRNGNELIIRLYEPEGQSGNTKLIFTKDIARASLVDLREQEIGDLVTRGNSVEAQVDPYSILTIRVLFI